MPTDWSSYNSVLDVFSILAAIITTFLTAFTFYIDHKTGHKFQKKIWYAISASNVFYSLSMIIMAVLYNIFDSNGDKTMKKAPVSIFGFLVHSIFHNWGIAATYILFILKVSRTFQGSSYQSSKYLYFSIYSSMVIFCCCHFCFFIITFLMFYKKITLETKSNLHSVILSFKAASLFYASIVLTFLFVSKLLMVALKGVSDETCVDSNRNSANSPSVEDEKDEKDVIVKAIKLQPKEQKFIVCATKMTVLSTIMALSTVTLICIALTSTFNSGTDLGDFLWHFGTNFLLIIDSVINAVCIFLSLPYKASKQSYDICCGFTFNRCCLHYVEKGYLTKKEEKIKKNTENGINLSLL